MKMQSLFFYMYMYLPWTLLVSLTAASDITCPFTRIRQLSPKDVVRSYVDNVHKNSDLSNLISHSSGSANRNFFYAFKEQNHGYFILSDDFVFTGFTTEGIDDNKTFVSYVSEFSFEIISSSSQIQNITQKFKVTTSDEVYLPLNYPFIPSHEVHFAIARTVRPQRFVYYWKLRFFGCNKADAIPISNADEEELDLDDENLFSSGFLPTPVNCTGSADTVTVTAIETLTMSGCSSFPAAIMSISTVVECSPGSGIQDQSASANYVGTMAGVISIAIVLCLISTLILTLTCVMYCAKRRTYHRTVNPHHSPLTLEEAEHNFSEGPINDPQSTDSPHQDMTEQEHPMYAEIIVYDTVGPELLRQSSTPSAAASIDNITLTTDYATSFNPAYDTNIVHTYSVGRRNISN